jgi:hypothetical protein
MTGSPPPPFTPPPAPRLADPDPRPPGQVRGGLLIGVAIGALAPLAAFLIVVRVGFDSRYAWVGQTVWAVVAFTGVLMLAFHRTRRMGLGVVLGFCGLLVVGAGMCTAAVVGSGG